MRFLKIFPSIIITSTLITTVFGEFDNKSKNNVAVYWGQASAGTQEDLSYYCDSDDVDIIILSFLNAYPGYNGAPTLSLATSCFDKYSNGVLDCPDIGDEITECQSKGKKILLALGGQAGVYGFTSDSEAEEFADTLWNLFGEGISETRPFGNSTIDGFDFDIENKNQVGYVALAKKLQEKFKSSSRDYYLSVAPQCVYPDASVSDLMDEIELDFAFIQFYNNDCSIDGQFNWDTWTEYATKKSPNKDIKLYLGLPGSSSAAATGYVDIKSVKTTVQNISSHNNFGGVMLWDVTQAYSNEDSSGDNFAKSVKSTLESNTKKSSKSSGVQLVTPSKTIQVSLLVCLLMVLLG
ncbi:Chitinase 2 [Wickerhamomyces ciferrii]|uniref:chitinase n=1 Tax=Wickerhamomyces ciferrii (strain ATCC 14091 / BCRC 22168 / CBS 111 / JCM 3599 / NBRC 0793 / NRRL Y-1031 F-60-10) TaxID=1206466 RepID=K0KHZ0_WICCF|nr:Chitinase 2 [Wickerhamomyces ciferrii]CCH41767.1 Chitinase 2 [Wickerhamomyces ciferrii]